MSVRMFAPDVHELEKQIRGLITAPPFSSKAQEKGSKCQLDRLQW